MLKNRFVGILILIAMIVLSACGDRKEWSLFDIMPLQSAVIVETTDPVGQMEEWKPYLQTCDVLRDFETQALFVDKLADMGAKSQKPHRTAYAIVKSAEDYAAFVVCDLDKKISDKELLKVLKSNGQHCEYLQNGREAYFRCDSLFVFSKSGFLVCSKDEALVKQVCRQFDNPSKMTKNDDFVKVQSTVGNAVRTHVYVHFSMLDDAVTASADDKHAVGATAFAAGLKGFSGLDMHTDEETVILNGYSKSADTSSCLRPLKYQIPVRNSVVNMLPFNTKLMLHYGMSDLLSFWEERMSKKDMTRLNKKYGVEIEKQFLPFMSEVAYCVFGNADQPVMVARINDPLEMTRFRAQMNNKAGIGATTSVQGYSLYMLNAKNFAPTVFGTAFGSLTGCCYAVVDQYLVIANDMDVLQDVVACYRSGRTLDLNENFKDFQNNMLESANITLYVAMAGNQNLIHRVVGGKMESFLQRNIGFLSQYQAFSVQFASARDLVYTCACLRKQGDVKQDDNVAWRVNLVAPLKGKPYLTERADSRCKDVVVFDADNTMYLIDCDGNILWKKAIPESPMSDVHALKERDAQPCFLFNTANYLHFIDHEGNDVDGFPKKLISEASNGLALIRYDGRTDPRVILCGTDRFVYNYTLNGDEVEGWNRHRTDDLVKRPVQHLVADNKDFIIVTDEKCAIRVLDRQGRVRIPLSSGLRKSQNACFYENKTNHKGVMLTTTENGELLYVAMDGGTARTDFGTFSDRHFFLYDDFNADADPDFIFLEGKSLQVFDRFKKVLFEREFDAEINSQPIFFGTARNKRWLCFVSENARELYMIDGNGKMMVFSGLVGSDSFAIANVLGDNDVNLITGSGNALFNYVIQ